MLWLWGLCKVAEPERKESRRFKRAGAGEALLSSARVGGTGDLRWGRGPSSVWRGVEKALKPAGGLVWGRPRGMGQGMGCLWGASPSQQQEAKGFSPCPGHVPAGGGLLLLSAGSLSFPSHSKAKPLWHGWSWGRDTGKCPFGAVLARARSTKAAACGVYFPFCINEMKAPGGFLPPWPHGGGCPGCWRVACAQRCSLPCPGTFGAGVRWAPAAAVPLGPPGVWLAVGPSPRAKTVAPSGVEGKTGAAHLGWENLGTGFLLRKKVLFPWLPPG